MTEPDPAAGPARSLHHRAPATATPQHSTDDALAGASLHTDDDGGHPLEATNRLVAEFAQLADSSTVTQVVRACCRDLRGAPAGALPELVERLARQRLREGTGLDPGSDLPADPEIR